MATDHKMLMYVDHLIYEWSEAKAKRDYFSASNKAVIACFYLKSGGEWPRCVSNGLFKEFTQWSVEHKIIERCQQSTMTPN